MDLEDMSDEWLTLKKLKKWFSSYADSAADDDDDETEMPEMAQKICKAIGYDSTKPMTAEEFFLSFFFCKNLLRC